MLDLNRLLPDFNNTGVWTGGDFNYDGSVNVLDLNALLPNFNASLPQVAPAVSAAPASSAVPTTACPSTPRTSALSSLATFGKGFSPADWISTYFKKSARKSK